MKKIILVIAIILFGVIELPKTQATDNEMFLVEENKILGVNPQYDIEILNEGYLLYNEEEIKYLYQNTELITLKEEYFIHSETKEYLFLITKNSMDIVIHKINNRNKHDEFNKLDLDNVCDLQIIDNEIIVVGSKDQNAVIYKYNMELEYLYSYSYGGKGFEEFKKIYYYNNMYYLIGSKDAHSINSPFLDVGNNGETKIFMSIIDLKGIIKETIYFNHQASREQLGNVDFIAGKFLLEIICEDYSYIYVLNEQLKNIDYQEKTYNSKTKIILSNALKITIVEENTPFNLTIKDRIWFLDLSGELKQIKMNDNVLQIYYYKEYYLYVANVYQYQIVHQEDIIINIFNGEFDIHNDMNELKELVVTSDIHNLNVVLESTIPSLNKQIPGNYKGIFKIQINNSKTFEIINPIIVEEYLNVFDDHIYPVGYQLKFWGYGMLDDKSVVSGIKLNDVGEHTLVVIDNAGGKKKIHFQIVDNYYNQEEEYPPTDYQLAINQELKLTINNILEDVTEVIVNGQSVPFVHENNIVSIKILPPGVANVYEYIIDEIVTSKGSILIDKKVTVKVLKEAPQFIITESSNEKLELDIAITDEKHSLKDLVLEIYNDEKLIEKHQTFLKNTDIKIGKNSVANNVKIKGYFIYDTGDGINRQIDFLNILMNNIPKDYELINVIISDDYKNISLEINTNHPDLVFKELIVNNTNLASKYQVYVNFWPIYIGVITSLIIVIGVGGYIYYRKKKKN